MKGGGNYNTGKAPDKISECQRKNSCWDTILKHSDTRLIY